MARRIAPVPCIAVGLAAAMVAMVAAAPAPAYPDRPAPAHTGGFGEPTCLACHFDGDLNPAGGALTVAGWPSRPVAGRTYPLVVRLTAPVMDRAGFQLSVRTRAGGQAGRLAPADDRTAVTDSAGVAYLHHTEAGSHPIRTRAAEWRLTWTAPRARPVFLHVAANAANGDASALGDAIYATSLVAGR